MTLAWLCLAWLAGVAAGQAAHMLVWQWLVLAAGALAAWIAFRRRSRFRLLFAGLLALSLGAARAVAAQPSFGPQTAAYYNDRPGLVTLEGVVTEPPDVRDSYVGLRVRAERLRLRAEDLWLPVRGIVLVQAPRLEDWAYGDRVQAAGRLETPPVFETFSYRDYLARQGVHSQMRQASVTRLATAQASAFKQMVYSFRSRALQTVYRLFPDPEASLLAGILLGTESGISAEVRQAFNLTGTSHIIAISGFNISIVAGLFVGLFARWFGRRGGAIAAAMGIAVYTLLVGAAPSVVRAAVMAGIALLAQRLGRPTDGLASLGGAAILMTAINPLWLWDAGFQLSFAATLGLILYAKPLKDWLVRRVTRFLTPEQAERLTGPTSEFALFTLAAQATTLPLTIYYFHRLSLASLVANPLILPAQPGLMIVGGLAAVLGMVWLPLGRPLAWIAWLFAAFTIRAVEFLARWSLAAIPLGRVTVPAVACLYAFLLGATIWARLPPEKRPRLPDLHLKLPWPAIPASAALVSMVLLIGLAWRLASDRPDGRLHLTVLDVGSGDATLVETPTGRFVLVDGGSSTISLSEALGRRLPLTHRHIDWLILGGTAEEQIAGLVGLTERFSVDGVLIAGPPGNGTYSRLLEELTETGCTPVPAQRGQVLALGGGASLEVSGLGERGAVLLLSYGGFRAILAPGADPVLLAAMLERGTPGAVTAVLLADGGYVAVNPPEWLSRLQPWVALISVEAGSRRGLPSPETLHALAGTTILRTDLNGWIELISDGEKLWVEVERVADEARESQ